MRTLEVDLEEKRDRHRVLQVDTDHPKHPPKLHQELLLPVEVDHHHDLDHVLTLAPCRGLLPVQHLAQKSLLWNAQEVEVGVI